MSAISLILLATAGIATGLGAAALHTARRMRGELAELRAELSAPDVPAPRTAPAAEEVRSAVAQALADERERELAEARAYWAEHDARGGDSANSLLAGRALEDVAEESDDELLDALLERYLLSDSGYRGSGREAPAFLPRQQDAGDAIDDAFEILGLPGEPVTEPVDGGEPLGAVEAVEPEELAEEATESAELAAARRRHPSHPGYTLTGEPVGEHYRTAARLAQLAEARTPLADVRPGPLGTLDVFRFSDGTTLCLSPSHQGAAERLAAAVRAGRPPVLMGGSRISGAYTLTFSCGEESIYLLADRVVATSSET